MVTFNRIPVLIENIDLFHKSIARVNGKTPFELISWVVLPDHCHMVINPQGNDLSSIVQRIKMSFGELFRRRRGLKSGRVWQNRFWDHIIRNQADMNKHIDYIHFNPVKHGLTRDPFEYEHSSLRRYFKEGYYQRDWGVREKLSFEGNYGE